jgi:hypothetical protein
MQGLLKLNPSDYLPQHEQEPLQEVEQAPPPLIPLELKVENFFFNRFDPQCGQVIPFVALERTRISLSFLHFSQ